MRRLDQSGRTALHLVVWNRSIAHRIGFGGDGLTYFPFAKIESVAQYEAQHLLGRAPGFPGKFFQAALLNGVQKQRGHGQFPVQIWPAYLITLSCDGHSPELRDISLIFATIGVVYRADRSGGAHLRLDRRPRDREFVVDHIERLCDQLRKLG